MTNLFGLNRTRPKLCPQLVSLVAVLLASSTILRAMDSVSAWNQILTLKDQSPWNSGSGEVKKYPEITRLVEQLMDSEGANVILRLLGSTSRDDYLRQVTIAAALKAKYTYKDLPTLCAIERNLYSLPVSAHETDRRWIDPRIAQLRIADWIEFLSNIPDVERIPKGELISDVDSWLQKTVGVAKNHTQNSSDADILGRCLVK